jgi:hypothetical protein
MTADKFMSVLPSTSRLNIYPKLNTPSSVEKVTILKVLSSFHTEEKTQFVGAYSFYKVMKEF